MDPTINGTDSHRSLTSSQDIIVVLYSFSNKNECFRTRKKTQKECGDLRFGRKESAFPMIGNANGPGSCHDNLYKSRRIHSTVDITTANRANETNMFTNHTCPQLNNDWVANVMCKVLLYANEITKNCILKQLLFNSFEEYEPYSDLLVSIESAPF